VPHGFQANGSDATLKARVADVALELPHAARTGDRRRRDDRRRDGDAPEPPIGVHPSPREGSCANDSDLDASPAWISLRRDRVAQTLTFILPITFFTIFASVFGNQGTRGTATRRRRGGGRGSLRLQRALVETLRQDGALDVRTTVGGRGGDAKNAARSERKSRRWCAKGTCRRQS
jgi:hypothetical protein